MCLVDPEKAFDRVLWKVVEWSMRKKGIPEVLVRSMMCLYEGANTIVNSHDSKLLEELEANLGDASWICAVSFLALGVDVTELARECVLSELLYVDDLVLTREAINGFRNKFMKWKVFESNVGKTKVMIS